MGLGKKYGERVYDKRIRSAINNGDLMIRESEDDIKFLSFKYLKSEGLYSDSDLRIPIKDTVKIFTDITLFDFKNSESLNKRTSYAIDDEGITLRPGNIYHLNTSIVVSMVDVIPVITATPSATRLGINVASSGNNHTLDGLVVSVTYPTKIYKGSVIATVKFMPLI